MDNTHVCTQVDVIQTETIDQIHSFYLLSVLDEFVVADCRRPQSHWLMFRLTVFGRFSNFDFSLRRFVFQC